MSKKLRKLLEGETVLISQGEYSDYGVNGLFRVLKDFEPGEVLQKYLKLHPQERKDYRFSDSGFLAYMSSLGLLEDLTHVEFHLGSYGRADEVSIF